MNTMIRAFLLVCGCFFYFSTSLHAQVATVSEDQLIGKWILKTASFNGEQVAITDMNQEVSFQFSADGQVVYIRPDGVEENGAFMVKDNKLIDPNIPEYPNADIISVSKKELILAMSEQNNRLIMTFALEVLE